MYALVLKLPIACDGVKWGVNLLLYIVGSVLLAGTDPLECLNLLCTQTLPLRGPLFASALRAKQISDE